MYFTPEAKLIIDKVLEERDFDCIRLDIVKEDGQDTVSLAIGKSSSAEPVTEIDGVRVIASGKTLQALAKVVFVVDAEGHLSIRELGGCGHNSEGCGCGHDESEGGCCCGGGHEHGEGGCGCDHGEHEHHHEGGCCGGANHEHGEGGCGCEHGEHEHHHEGGCCGGHQHKSGDCCQ